MQYFKGDDVEKKFVGSVGPLMDILSASKTDFFNNAYTCALLGDLMFAAKSAPLANAIAPSIFRIAFSEIFDAFIVAGSFESYLTVFRKIFGEDVEIDFEIPSPGRLNIDIVATGVEESPFVARYIEDNEYYFDQVVDDVGDKIVFQTIKGFTTQYELEQMLFEMVPGGVFTDIDLELGI